MHGPSQSDSLSPSIQVNESLEPSASSSMLDDMEVQATRPEDRGQRAPSLEPNACRNSCLSPTTTPNPLPPKRKGIAGVQTVRLCPGRGHLQEALPRYLCHGKLILGRLTPKDNQRHHFVLRLFLLDNDPNIPIGSPNPPPALYSPQRCKQSPCVYQSGINMVNVSSALQPFLSSRSSRIQVLLQPHNAPSPSCTTSRLE
ncbi:hypothetical protein DFP72DRAFT_1163555 [Ephemerocybe angulata]|uniref:Uncharacterized protein n=1 Tax=Ephemerocybe angulata TaxID=980116 RepID=A0A8H6IFW0_9AGAR|nr:hypothetical protein DFP72DRAFT_1163555 [Tulosesus angulatus]